MTALALSCAGVALLTEVQHRRRARRGWPGPRRTASASSCTSCSATGSPRRIRRARDGRPVVSTGWPSPWSSRRWWRRRSGVAQAAPAFAHPAWLLWGIGVGVCSTVIPYVADQWAMARLPRASYALMLALLPVTATVCGLVVLGQVPARQELVGIGLVGAAVALHRPAGEAS